MRPCVLFLMLAAAGCTPTSPELVLTWPDGDKITYSATDADGADAPLMFEPVLTGAFSQAWTAAGDGPRDQVTMAFGSFIESVTSGGGIERDVASFTASGGESTGANYSITEVTFTGDAERPVLFSASMDGPSQGRFTVGASCGEGARSNHGCGFAAPDGVASGEIAWPGDAMLPWEDGCSGPFWSDELAAGTWAWTESSLTLANGRELDCVMTASRELICGATWTAEVAVSVGPDCPWKRTLIVWPEVGAPQHPNQLRAYFYAESKEKLGAEVDICQAGNSCVAFQ